MVPAQPRPPDLSTLERVIPVGQTETREGWTITCIAIELYDDGFRIGFRVYGAHTPTGNPRLALTVRDDRDTQYRPWGSGGNGSGFGQAYDWRLSANCTPQLDPTARELKVEIAEVQILEYDETRDERDRLFVGKRFTGPWRFTIALAGGTNA